MKLNTAHGSLSTPRALPWAVFCLLGGVVSQAMSWQSILGSEGTASALVSPGLWHSLVATLGGRVTPDNTGGFVAEVNFLPLLLAWSVLAAVSGLLAAWLMRQTTGASWNNTLARAGFSFGWWWLMGAWELLRLLAFSVGLESVEQFLLVSPQMWQAVALAGWLVQPFAESGVSSSDQHSGTAGATCDAPFFRRHRSTLILALLIVSYVVVFTAMNWRLWFNLRIPHGDSAMYEEHLWNVTHGKGFRSYLDQGLFLGEHIQVIHLLLLPLHVLWPSHLLLELCESTALALGAIPVFRIAQRSTGSDRAGWLLAAAYLLYFPLHFLDIEIDLKTFRPESFCVPFFLFAFDALEQGRLRRMLILLLIALSAKEDYSIIIAPLGVWIAARAYVDGGLCSPLSSEARAREQGRRTGASTSEVREQESCTRRARMIWGLSLAAFGVAYLVLATRVVIPCFRGGAELHYVKYFSKFGDTMGQVVWNMLTQPRLLFGELLTVKTALYFVSLLLPVGFVALLSPGRLVVGLPLFGILCLNELAQDPRHHFHAPLVPIVFWATAVGVQHAGVAWDRVRGWWYWFVSVVSRDEAFLLPTRSRWGDSFARQFVWSSAFASGLFLSIGPAGIGFWDPHSSMSLWQLYAHDPRADQFANVFSQIPRTARVASTDFVHPRFTHHERSYDYSHYRRRIAGYADRVPADTDFIVIDTRHPYSDIRTPAQVRELREEPDRWELLPDQTQGYFITLRRKETPK